LTITCTISEISVRNSSELIVFNTPGLSTIGIRTGKTLNIFSDTSATGMEVRRYCATLGLKRKSHSLLNKFYCIRAGEKSIVISNSLDDNMLKTFRPDIIVITGLPPDTEKNLHDVQSPEAIIITSGTSTGFYNTWHGFYTDCDTLHIVKKSGAYIKRI
jgi:hypothetical protein